MLTRFYYKNVDDFRLPIAVEERFELDMGGFILSGVMDRVDCNPDGTSRDHRLQDQPTPAGAQPPARDLQLPIYQLACEIWA